MIVICADEDIFHDVKTFLRVVPAGDRYAVMFFPDVVYKSSNEFDWLEISSFAENNTALKVARGVFNPLRRFPSRAVWLSRDFNGVGFHHRGVSFTAKNTMAALIEGAKRCEREGCSEFITFVGVADK